MKFNNEAEAIIALVKTVYNERKKKDLIGNVIHIDVFFGQNFYSEIISKTDRDLNLEYADPTIVSIYYRDRGNYMERLRPSVSDNIINLDNEKATSVDILDYFAINNLTDTNDEPKLSLSYKIPEDNKLIINQLYKGKNRILYLDIK